MKNKIITSLIILIFILMIATSVNAAIEIKPGTTTHTNITVSNSYQYCYNMRNPTSSLGNNTLDPHLTLNKDWAAVAYLGLSGYGAVTSSTGDTTTVSGLNYTTTTGNPTGVLNFGTTYTQTAGVTNTLKTVNSTYSQFQNIQKNINSEYVEVINTSNNPDLIGKALYETGSWYGASLKYPSGNTTGYFGFVRSKISILYDYGTADGYLLSIGKAYSNISYRPVIWN